MNQKAQKFNIFLQMNGLTNDFVIQEVKNEFETVLFLSIANIDGEEKPVKVLMDNSSLVLFQVRVFERVVKKSNRARVLEKLNELNDLYKLFKYYVDEEGSLIVESCLPAPDDHFEAEMVYAVLELIFNHLSEVHGDLKKVL